MESHNLNQSITIFAPATVANVACGFDSLGFSLNEPGDEVIISLSDSPGVKITKITGDDGKLPLDAESNTAGVSVLAFLKSIKSDQGIDIEIHKQMPLGSGLGSSAASSVAAVVGANELLGKPLSKKDLLPFAILGEKKACGSAHADNVAPALLGGFILIRSYNPLDVVSIPFPEQLYATVLHPHIELRTEDVRKIMRREIKLQDAIVQWSNLAGLIAGLMKSDYSLISRSLNDIIFEPVRSLLIPGFDEVKQAAMQAGALGCSISGSGPSVFALCTTRTTAQEVGDAMQQALTHVGLQSDLYVSPINGDGVSVVKQINS
ncbi:MAG: homoserine kinase [Balneolales bacterium]